MEPQVPLIPHHMVKSKQPVDAGVAANATYAQFAKPLSDSFTRLEEERVLTSFKESVVQVWPGPGRLDTADPAGHHSNLEAAKAQPPKPFEMPDGWNQVFGIERFRVAEGLFDANAALRVSPIFLSIFAIPPEPSANETFSQDPNNAHPIPDAKQTIPAMLNASLNAVDVEIRPQLLHNVVLTGGGSLIEKMAERISHELTTLLPNPKVRVQALGPVDRKYGAWIGGSVLASLGTFHQMWVSRKEYEEHGAGIVEKRCK